MVLCIDECVCDACGQIVRLGATGRFNFVAKLHGRCRRIFDSAEVPEAEQYLNPLNSIEIESLGVLKGAPGITIVPTHHHNLLPFLDAFDTVRPLAVCVCVCL